MSQEPSNPAHASTNETESTRQREAFVVRVWRAAEGDGWRCHLIHVGTGHHLPCDHPDEVGARIEAWLAQAGRGLR